MIATKFEPCTEIKIPEDKIKLIKRLADDVVSAEQGIKILTKHYTHANDELWKTIREIMPEIVDNYEVRYDYTKGVLEIRRTKDKV
jgi:hypothetical protein